MDDFLAKPIDAQQFFDLLAIGQKATPLDPGVSLTPLIADPDTGATSPQSSSARSPRNWTACGTPSATGTWRPSPRWRTRCVVHVAFAGVSLSALEQLRIASRPLWTTRPSCSKMWKARPTP
jgi:hypothetical protein